MIKQPRQKSDKHLDFIRSLPCLVCKDNTSTEAAHIRMSCARVGKRPVGTGEKPDDAWTIPLCGKCHRIQHSMHEVRFWNAYDLDPILTALALYRVTGNHELGCQIIGNAHIRDIFYAEQAV